MRRGRPTVWKLWGTDHAINTGDAELLLAFDALDLAPSLSDKKAKALHALLAERYLAVIEGQYLDFTLAAAGLTGPKVSRAAYLTMLDHKTAKLFRAATEVGGVIAGRATREVKALGDFGENLGMAYQLYDDWQSIWGNPKETGKKRAGDLYERKKTLPIIYARDHLPLKDARRLTKLYNKKRMTRAEVVEVLALLEKTDARAELERTAKHYKVRALQALEKTTLDAPTRELLADLARTLVPDTVAASR